MAALPAKRSRKSYMWVKLSNSGEILKLKVPSSIWKNTSGWTNYSGMVTSLKMSENEMDNRGSKSIFVHDHFYLDTHKANNNNEQYGVVKEQRVDGSWFVNPRLANLRCTLMGPERGYQVRIRSKQIRAYSTYNPLELVKLNPWFITGFSDAEGCFMVSVVSRPDTITKWRDSERN